MESNQARLKRLFPRVVMACKGNDLALRELGKMLEHMDLLQNLNNRYRLKQKRERG